MIARLALVEAGIDHEQIFVDILFRGNQQAPAYARLNPGMTVPTLVLPERMLIQSREILDFSLARTEGEADSETKSWIDLHYAFPVEELTFGMFLARHAFARAVVPAKLAASRRRLLALAITHPELAGVYNRRAAVFAERERIFDPKNAVQLVAKRREEAVGLLDQLETRLSDRRETIVPPNYGAADVVWTVFLARMEFVGMAEEIACRPTLSRYWKLMKARPSFAAADIWTRFEIGRVLLGIIRGERTPSFWNVPNSRRTTRPG